MQSAYSSHVPFSVSRNSKPTHHELCSLAALLQAWSQSAFVDFLPALPLPSSWSANQRSKSWSAERKQRSVCCYDDVRCSDSFGMPSARSAACHCAFQFLSACSCADCSCAACCRCNRCCSACRCCCAAASCCCDGGEDGFGGKGGQGFHGGEGGAGDGGSESNHHVGSGFGCRCCFACVRTGSHASSSSVREPPAFA